MSDAPEIGLDVSAVPADPRGAGRYTIDLAATLAQRHEIALTLITRRDDKARWWELAPDAAVIGAVPGPRPARLAWEQMRMPRLLARLDLRLLHSPHYTMPERAKLPRVVTIHDLTFFDHPEWHERAKVPVFRRAIGMAARHADALICVSRSTAERLDAILSPTVPVHVVPHGVDLVRFRPHAADPAADEAILAGLGIKPPYIAFVGTIEPRKDLPTLVRAFDVMAAAHADVSLVLAGGEGWGGDALGAALAIARHADRVVRTGYVPDEAVPAILRHATAAAYTAIEEGFGLPALEALACGTPLVTTAGTSMEEVAKDAALLVQPGDARGLAGALDMLVREDEGLATRRTRGLAVAARHTWAASAEGHIEVYRTLL